MMASTSTAKAFILRGGQYNDESRKNPGLAFMEVINSHFDSRDHSGYEDLYTEDYKHQTPHGDDLTHEAGYHDDHSFHAAASKYYMDPLDDHEHFVDEVISIESKTGGYDVYWMGDLYAHVKGEPAEGEKKVKDPQGKEWDVVVPVSYHFDMVPDKSSEHGLKMAGIKTWKDTHLINDLLDKRDHGHLKSLSN